ncbi:hypothetical protein MTQ01_20355 [Streptomyces sp. XM4193]|uniref:hypothetical protein n=1 Tax=Streptomyces sp. XM4193 TaxID=2929782 RepID=UPI001FFA8136|nr:hypothetical protein [Streptomyces sp. XM4193]MCK1798335.1 hypothetical protein [Streptomyces sp. XM4193]
MPQPRSTDHRPGPSPGQSPGQTPRVHRTRGGLRGVLAAPNSLGAYGGWGPDPDGRGGARRAPAGPVPASIRASSALWLLAVAAGVFETLLGAGQLAADADSSGVELALGLLVRGAVYGAVVWLVLRLRAGSNRARLLLAFGLGVFGTLSLVAGPLGHLLDGGGVGDALASAGAVDLLFGASRTLHLLAVLAAVPLMFRPAANSWISARS